MAINPYETSDPDFAARAQQAAMLRSMGGAPTSPGTRMPGRSRFGGGGQYSAAGTQQSQAGSKAGNEALLAAMKYGKGKGWFSKLGSMFGGGGVPELGAGATGPGLQASGATTFAAGPETAIGASGGGGGGFGSMLSSAGPWAALAAAIIGNETSAHKSNYNWTDDQGVEHKDPLRPGGPEDMFTGKVLQYDVDRRWNPWMEELTGGDKERGKEGWWGKSGLAGDTSLGAKLGSPWSWGDISKDDLQRTTLGKLLKKVF